MPNSIIYFSSSDLEKFDYERFRASLQEFGEIDEGMMLNELQKLSIYDPLHVSCLVEVGVKSIKDTNSARAYYKRYSKDFRDFERLRRITGYLVGTLSRWNDAKQAEEKARVKHSVVRHAGQYTQEEKAEIEAQKLENSVMAQF